MIHVLKRLVAVLFLTGSVLAQTPTNVQKTSGPTPTGGNLIGNLNVNTGSAITASGSGVIEATSTTGNAATATKLQTARAINGALFDGTAPITIKATATNALTFGTHLTGGSYDGSAPVAIATDGVSANTASTLVARDGGGNFSATTITANLNGNASGSSGSVANALTIGTHLTGTSYNGGSPVTIATDATSSNTASTLMARDSSGNFSAGGASVSSLSATTGFDYSGSAAATFSNSTAVVQIGASAPANGVSINGGGSGIQVRVNPGFAIVQGSQTGETGRRWGVKGDGTNTWGDGTSATDTTLYRNASGVLKTDGLFLTTGIGIGTGATSPISSIQVVDTVTSTPRGIIGDQYSTGTSSAQFNGRKARGTFSSPTTISSGDVLATFRAWGHDGTGFVESGNERFVSSGTVGTNRIPSQWEVWTSTDASPSVLTRGLWLDNTQTTYLSSGAGINALNGFNVKYYGAKGDGSTDDLSAINSAITAAGSGGVVYFPSGTYEVSATLNSPLSGQTWYFSGAKLQTRASFSGAYLIHVTNPDVKIIGAEFLGKSDNNGQAAVNVDAALRVAIIGCKLTDRQLSRLVIYTNRADYGLVSDCYTNGVGPGAFGSNHIEINDCYYCTATRNIIVGNGETHGNGIELYENHAEVMYGAVVTDNTIDSVGQSGVDVFGNRGAKIMRNTIRKTQSYGIYLTVGEVDPTIPTDSSLVSGNYLQDCGTTVSGACPLFNYSGTNSFVSNVVFNTGSVSLVSGGPGIDWNSGDDGTVDANIVVGSVGNGIYINSGARPKVTNNTVINPGSSSGTTYGLQLVTATAATIRNNCFTDTRAGAARGMSYGAVIGAASSGDVFASNSYTNYITASYVDNNGTNISDTAISYSTGTITTLAATTANLTTVNSTTVNATTVSASALNASGDLTITPGQGGGTHNVIAAPSGNGYGVYKTTASPQLALFKGSATDGLWLWSNGTATGAMTSGFYYNGSAQIYGATGHAVSGISLAQNNYGDITFLQAPSGTAGGSVADVATMTMTAAPNYNMLIGTTTDNGAKLQVSGTATISGAFTAQSTTDSSSAATGSIITSGGVGVAKSVYIGSAAPSNGFSLVVGSGMQVRSTGGQALFQGSATGETGARFFVKSTDGSVNFGDGTNVTDTVIKRDSANVITTGGPFRLTNYVVSGLPSASSSGSGAMAYVTDSTLTAITGLGLAVIGGGSNKVAVISDGNNWIIQ